MVLSPQNNFDWTYCAWIVDTARFKINLSRLLMMDPCTFSSVVKTDGALDRNVAFDPIARPLFSQLRIHFRPDYSFSCFQAITLLRNHLISFIHVQHPRRAFPNYLTSFILDTWITGIRLYGVPAISNCTAWSPQLSATRNGPCHIWASFRAYLALQVEPYLRLTIDLKETVIRIKAIRLILDRDF